MPQQCHNNATTMPQWCHNDTTTIPQQCHNQGALFLENASNWIIVLAGLVIAWAPGVGYYRCHPETLSHLTTCICLTFMKHIGCSSTDRARNWPAHLRKILRDLRTWKVNIFEAIHAVSIFTVNVRSIQASAKWLATIMTQDYSPFDLI